jgi:hypothetical protein
MNPCPAVPDQLLRLDSAGLPLSTRCSASPSTASHHPGAPRPPEINPYHWDRADLDDDDDVDLADFAVFGQRFTGPNP